MGAWQKLSSRYVHQNPYYKIRCDEVITPSGKPGQFFVMEDGRAVYIIPVTEDGKIILVRQFRYTTQQDSWELPAGGIEADETPLAAAQRELQEETGKLASHWEDLGVIQASNGKTDAMGHAILATGLSTSGHDEQTEEGITNMKAFTMHEIQHMIAHGEITDSQTLSPILLAIAQDKLRLSA